MKNLLLVVFLLLSSVVVAEAQSLLYNPQRYNSSLYVPREAPYKPNYNTPQSNNLQAYNAMQAKEEDDSDLELSASAEPFFLASPEDYEVGVLYRNWFSPYKTGLVSPKNRLYLCGKIK